MLYKLAAKKISKKDEKHLAMNRVMLGQALAIPTGGLSYPIVGLLKGMKVNHGTVGLLLGPAGVNGARAKDTGISTLGTTMGTGTVGGALIGGLAGAARGVNPAATAIGGAALGGLGSAANYGLGHLLGKKQKHPKAVS